MHNGETDHTHTHTNTHFAFFILFRVLGLYLYFLKMHSSDFKMSYISFKHKLQKETVIKWFSWSLFSFYLSFKVVGEKWNSNSLFVVFSPSVSSVYRRINLLPNKSLLYWEQGVCFHKSSHSSKTKSWNQCWMNFRCCSFLISWMKTICGRKMALWKYWTHLPSLLLHH